MNLLWFLLPLGMLLLAMDQALQRMYAYHIQPHRKTPQDYGIPFEELRIPTEKGKTLYGWWIPGQANAPTIVLIHGWSRNLERMMRYIRRLHPLGYHLLAFDARNHGSSDREPHPTVMTFTEDTCAALRFLRQTRPHAATRLGLIGLSVGGGAAINAAVRCPEGIHSVITVGAIAHPVATMQEAMQRRGLPPALIHTLLRFMALRYRLDFDAIAPVNHIGQVQARLLLIHGDRDETVSLAQGKRLLAAARPERAQLWVVPGKGHSNCASHPEFWPRVEAFLQETLPC